VEVGLHDVNAGVGKVDGYDVVVADAAKLVGKKVEVTVGRALDGIAYATLSEAAPAATPITFEAEAEKPTRASRAKPGAKAVEVAEDDADVTEVEQAEPDAELEVADDAAAASATAEDEAAAVRKKRTRRGTRGGRKRKKPATAEAAGANGSGPAED